MSTKVYTGSTAVRTALFPPQCGSVWAERAERGAAGGVAALGEGSAAGRLRAAAQLHGRRSDSVGGEGHVQLHAKGTAVKRKKSCVPKQYLTKYKTTPCNAMQCNTEYDTIQKNAYTIG